MWLTGAGGREGGQLFSGYIVSVTARWVSSRDLLYSIVPICNNIGLGTSKFKRVDLM